MNNNSLEPLREQIQLKNPVLMFYIKLILNII